MFRDAHLHLFAHARQRSMLCLAHVRSPQECCAALADAARSTPPGHWVLAHSLRVQAWDDPRYPTIDELDHAVPDHPLCARSFDHHALVANSRALLAANLPPSDPPGGVIVRDPSGRPTGLLLEAAARLVWNAVPEPTPDQRSDLLRTAVEDLASLGFTHVHDLLAQPWLGPALRALDDTGALPLHVTLFVPLDDLPQAFRTRGAWESDRVRLGGAKVFVDGTLNSRTAWMLEPYADPLPDHPRGTPLLSPDRIDRAIDAAARSGLALAAHAIGDAAVRAVLDAVGRRSPPPGTVRIEHAELVHPADVPRFASLGVVASVQPCHLLPDTEALRRLLPDRLDRVLPLRDLIDAGCTPGRSLIFGSDAPIVPPDPADSLRAAVHRCRPDADPIAPHQAITPDQAWAAFGAQSPPRPL